MLHLIRRVSIILIFQGLLWLPAILCQTTNPDSPTAANGKTSAQASSKPSNDPKAVALLQQSFNAMGGQAVAGITNVVMSGQMTHQLASEQVTGTVSFEWGGAETCRLDFTSDKYSRSLIVNQGAGLEIENGVSHAIPAHAVVNNTLKYLPVVSEVSSWQDSSFLISYVGEEQLDKIQVYHLHLENVPPDLSDRTTALYKQIAGVEIYLDETTMYVVKRTQQLPAYADMGSTMLLEQYFSAYQTISGIAVPQQISISVQGQKLTDIQITDVKFNSDISASEFKVQQ